MGSRYKYKHLDYVYCADLENKLCCPYPHCPYILGNLDDLRHDRTFRNAARHARNCIIYHRPALFLDDFGSIVSKKPLHPRFDAAA